MKSALNPETSKNPQLAPVAHRNRWMVVIHNNDHNSVDEVIFVLMRATGCTRQEAEIETWEAHTYGKASVHFSDELECVAVSRIIESIGVYAEVQPEWQ